MKRASILTLGFLLLIFSGSSQILQSTAFVKGSIDDGEKIIKAYLSPFERSLAVIGGNGFTGFPNKNKKKNHIKIGIEFGSTITPKTERTYNPDDLNLTEFEVSNSGDKTAQTFSGNSNSIQIETKSSYKIITSSFPFYKDKALFTLNTPEGSGSPLLTLPFLTAFYNNEGLAFKLRLMPPIKIPKVDASIFSIGTGGQTRLSNKIKVLKSIPVHIDFGLALQYTLLTLDPGLQPEDTRTEISLQADNGPYNNQAFFVHSLSLPIGLVFSREFNHFLLFGGLGYQVAYSKVELTGNIPVYLADPTNTARIIIEDFKDPISYTQKHHSPRIELGVKYLYKSFDIIATYTYSKHNSFNLGLGMTL